MPSEVETYVDTIWGDGSVSGVVYLPVADRNHNWTRGFANWPSQRAQIIDHILTNSAAGNEVYVGPVIYERKPIKGEKLGKELIKGSWVLWADFDGNAPQNWDSPVQDHIGAEAYAPTLRNITSTPDRQHCYWVMDEFLTDIKLLENLNRTIALDYGADRSGWDATQLLRPPGTTNHGYGKEEREGTTYPVRIEEHTRNVYPTGHFRATQDFRPLVSESLQEIPGIEEVLARGTWSEDLYKLYNDTPKANTRSDALMLLAYMSAEAGFTDEYIYTVLVTVDERWGKYTHRADKHARYVDIIERARQKHPYGANNRTFAGLLDPNSPIESVFEKTYTLGELQALDIQIDWFLEGLMMKNGYGLIVGDPGIGKTQFTIRLVQELARQRDFLDWDNSSGRPLKVLFLSLEMNPMAVQYFHNTMELADEFGNNYLIRFVRNDLSLDVPGDDQKQLSLLLDEFKPDVLFIDSLSRVVSGSLTDDTVVRNFNKHISYVRNRHECSVLTIHHNRKSQQGVKSSPTLDNVYGSRFLTAEADFVLYLSLKDEESDLIMVSTVKTRLGKHKPPFLVRRTNDLNFEKVSMVSGPENERDREPPNGTGGPESFKPFTDGK